MMRVSPPDDDRELPGPHASSSVTRAPRRNRYKADHPPNAPAPTTATWEVDCMVSLTKALNVVPAYWLNEEKTAVKRFAYPADHSRLRSISALHPAVIAAVAEIDHHSDNQPDHQSNPGNGGQAQH